MHELVPLGDQDSQPSIRFVASRAAFLFGFGDDGRRLFVMAVSRTSSGESSAIGGGTSIGYKWPTDLRSSFLFGMCTVAERHSPSALLCSSSTIPSFQKPRFTASSLTMTTSPCVGDFQIFLLDCR